MNKNIPTLQKCCRTELSLDGPWTLAGYPNTSADSPIHLTGTVPGQVHADLLRQGHIPDPFWRDQAQQCQWIEQWDWHYSRQFDLPADWTRGWQVLEFDGLDTFAEIRLNGQEVGKTDNMFIPHRFEVGHLLLPGRNTLDVHLTAPAKALINKPADKYFSCFSNDRVYARKMQCSYGWDWLNRFVSAGICRPVRLTSYDTARIADVYLATKNLADDIAEMIGEINIEKRADESLFVDITLLDPQGRLAYQSKTTLNAPTLSMTFNIKSPQLWWPNGQGDQPLYHMQIAIYNSREQCLDRRELKLGIRTVELEQIPDDVGGSFTFKINGRRIFCKGGNWVPADPFPARITPDHYDRMIQLAKNGNMNMLRCWGGGIYEPDAFWDACDRHGIMIIQDFMLACAVYPEDDTQFLEALRIEFDSAVRQLRNRPSLVLWSGNNELGMNDDPSTQFPGKLIAEQISGPLCRKLDPHRPFQPSSPFGGNPNNSPSAGDCHISTWYDADFQRSDMADYRRRFDDKWGRFASEYVVAGPPAFSSLRKFMAEDDLASHDVRLWEYHTRDNPYSGMSDLTHFKMLANAAVNLFGPTNDPYDRVRRMQYVHVELARITAEALRRRMFDCSGLLFWMYNDCWPASGWSLIDYYSAPKAGYYGAKRGFAPVIAAIQPETEQARIWLCSDHPKKQCVTLTTRFQPWQGPALWQMENCCELSPGTAIMALEVPFEKMNANGMLVCDVRYGEKSDRAVFYPDAPRQMILPPARLKTQITNRGNHGTITISTDAYARMVTLEADLDFHDNYFDLLPGETRTIHWTCPAGNFTGSIHTTCWNAEL